jgi:hypothetical protein
LTKKGIGEKTVIKGICVFWPILCCAIRPKTGCKENRFNSLFLANVKIQDLIFPQKNGQLG